jgi:hypothetical protein
MGATFVLSLISSGVFFHEPITNLKVVRFELIAVGSLG